MQSEDHLVTRGISKSFGSVRANDNVSITVKRGTVHAILGENGAGKSTLMSILYGLIRPDGGEILINGRVVSIRSPRHALDLGIGMVHQHFMLVDPLTVTENVVLGSKPTARLDLGSHERRLLDLSGEFGFDVDPRKTVSKLPVGMQQRVEILKALYHDADLIILDEPTSVLTPSETRSFFEVLRCLRRGGKTIVLITHKLDEVMSLTDRVTVMRGGRVTDEVATSETNPAELARLMVGRDVVLNVKRSEGKPGKPLLMIRDLRSRGSRMNWALNGLSLTVHEGEILGVAGVDGNGQAELAEVISGLRPYQEGSASLLEQELSGFSVAERTHDLGIAYVPEDRHRTGLVLDQSIASNLILRSCNRAPFAGSFGILNAAKIRENALRLVATYKVKCETILQDVRRLSGGNQQKLILAREISRNPRLLIVAQAVKGLDVGAIEFVQQALLAQRDRGMGILYISTELEHIFAICDRIAVMSRGRITGVLPNRDATPERIGQLMSGMSAEVA